MEMTLESAALSFLPAPKFWLITMEASYVF